ncbi:uncharacterized protein LOC144145364 [Haemaphysalis longicornis]
MLPPYDFSMQHRKGSQDDVADELRGTPQKSFLDAEVREVVATVEAWAHCVTLVSRKMMDTAGYACEDEQVGASHSRSLPPPLCPVRANQEPEKEGRRRKGGCEGGKQFPARDPWIPRTGRPAGC